MQPGQEEQEVVGNLFPGRGQHHHQHGLIAIQRIIPVNARGLQRAANQPDIRVEQENIKNGGNGRRHGIGPDQQRAIGILATNMPVGQHRQAKRQAHGKHGDGQ